MRILMLLSNPFTDDARVFYEASSLQEAGHEVMVLGWDRKGDLPQKEEKDGIPVVRVQNSGLMRLLPLDLLRLGPLQGLLARRAAALRRDFPFDAVHAHDLDTLEAGIRIKKEFGVPLLYDAHEIWGWMLANDVPGFVANHFIKKERRIIKKPDRMITVSQALKEYFQDMGAEPVVVMNCKPVEAKEYEPPSNEKLEVLYIGAFSKSRMVADLARVCEGMEGVHCTIAGRGKDKENVEAACKNNPGVTYLGPVPRTRVLPMTAAADVIICMMDPANRNNRVGSPNKLFEAMASGRPVICSEGTYSGAMTEQEKTGIAVPHTPDGLRKGIERLRDDPALRERLGRSALKAALAKYNWKAQAAKLVEVYRRLERPG